MRESGPYWAILCWRICWAKFSYIEMTLKGCKGRIENTRRITSRVRVSSSLEAASIELTSWRSRWWPGA
jgi:hypothetical protein